jgi:hypothetical protein
MHDATRMLVRRAHVTRLHSRFTGWHDPTPNKEQHMAATVTHLNLSGWKQARKALGRRLQREDFPATPEGWTSFCDYRIWLNQKAQSRATRAVDYYKSVRTGEHLQSAVAKLDALAELQKQLDLARQEVAMLKAGTKPEPKPEVDADQDEDDDSDE